MFKKKRKERKNIQFAVNFCFADKSSLKHFAKVEKHLPFWSHTGIFHSREQAEEKQSVQKTKLIKTFSYLPWHWNPCFPKPLEKEEKKRKISWWKNMVLSCCFLRFFAVARRRTLPAVNLAPSELLYSISHMLNQTGTSINKLYIFQK
jgi:hypothetical protein